MDQLGPTGGKIHTNGPETKPNLAQARKPTSPKEPNNIGKERMKYKGYAELNQDTGRSDLAGPIHVKQTGQICPVVVQSMDQIIESNKDAMIAPPTPLSELERLKPHNQLLDTGFLMNQENNFKKRSMTKALQGINYEKQTLDKKKFSNAYDENVNQFDLKFLQANGQINNENSYTLFDKSLQEDSFDDGSFNDQIIGDFKKDQQKSKDMLTQRRLLSNKMRESIIKQMNIKNDNLRLMDQDPRIIERFGPYKNIIENLIEKYIIETSMDLVTCVFSNDSTRIIAVMTESEERFTVVMYCTDTFEIRSSLTISGDYIKAKNVSQNSIGNLYAIPFIEDEVFKITIFNKMDVLQELDVSEMIGFEKGIRPIDSIPYPLINVVFVDESSIFVLSFDPQSKQIWYFTYNIIQKSFKLEPQKLGLQCTTMNFPVDSFYDSDRDLVHIFFRQGQALSIDPNKIKHVFQQEITEFDLGEMQFYDNKILLVKSSEVIDLYQIVEDHEIHKNYKMNRMSQGIQNAMGNCCIKWNKYYTLNHTGFVQLTPNCNTFQIIGSDLIQFFKFPDVESEPIPELSNTMQNFMLCEQMLISIGERFALTYKVGEPDLKVFLRRFDHGYVERACDKSREGCSGTCLKSKNCFIISDLDNITIHDEITFKVIQNIEVPIQVSTTRDPIEIINIVISQNDQYLSILSGKVLPKQIEEIHQLHVYKITKSLDVELLKTIDLPERYRNVSKCFSFNIKRQDREILLFTKSCVFLYDYISESGQEILTFNNLLNAQPDYMTFNESQEIGIIATEMDILWLNLMTADEVDIDEIYEISCVKAITLFNEKFYILSNKYQKKLGYFLLEIDIDKPMQTKRPKFIIKWTNKLQINDAALNFIFIERENMKGEREHKVEMVVSYKTIHINQFVIIVVEMDTCLIKFRFEMYQLWESPIKGFMNKSHDFIILNKAGLSFIPLGNQQKKIIANPDGADRLVHSLESLSYLKIEDSNHIKITRPQNNTKQRTIWISEQFTDTNGETRFEDLYQVNVCEMTLIELILTQSIFSCKSLTHIYNLIELQPEPSLFFKSFLELDIANMVSILSFDSRCIYKLLSNSEEIAECNPENPLFYKIQHEKPNDSSIKITTALDIALESNQISAANMIIEYIQKYQNSYVFLFLFQDNFIKLIEKGIKLSELLQSDIFCHQFDFEDWPLIHEDDSYCMAPYNDSIFQLRGKYSKTFRNIAESEECDKLDHQHDEDEEGHEEESSNVKVYKIKYTINVLPGLVRNSYDDEQCFLDLLADTEEDELFNTKVIGDTLVFFWEEYGCVVHYTGAFIHFAYVITFALYLNFIYMYRDYEHRAGLCTAMCICLIYPTVYDFLQCFKQGMRDYFADPWNWLDQAHIWFGFTNIAVQRFTPDIMSIPTQLLMVTVIFMMLVKTFFFLRIFDEMSFLVKMIGQVMHDLKAFLIFYAIICFMFSMLFAVIDLDNFEFSINEKTRAEKAQPQYPAMEYRYLGKFLGHFCTVIRISIGDFQFDSVNKLPMFENMLYWFLWYVVVTVTCIIFLNFIIAEVSASYQIVKDNIEVLCMKEKATLIKEAEEMLLARFGKERMQQWTHLFPKYIICRETDS